MALKKWKFWRTACMNLVEIMLSRINQSQKDKHCVIPHTWDAHRGVIPTATESNTEVACGHGKGAGELFDGGSFSVLQDDQSRGDGGGSGCTTMWMHSIHWPAPLTMVHKISLCYVYFTTVEFFGGRDIMYVASPYFPYLVTTVIKFLF